MARIISPPDPFVPSRLCEFSDRLKLILQPIKGRDCDSRRLSSRFQTLEVLKSILYKGQKQIYTSDRFNPEEIIV